MFPSLVIFSGAGSTLDLQAVEPLKSESHLLKPLTQNKIMMCLLLHRKCSTLSQMNPCSTLHSSYANSYTATTLSTHKNIRQEACHCSLHTKNASLTCIQKAKAKSSERALESKQAITFQPCIVTMCKTYRSALPGMHPIDIFAYTRLPKDY